MPAKREPPAAPADSARSGLRADCERCFALCCVAPAFAASADFAIDKEAGQACPNLRSDFGCGIHQRLRQQGFRGCACYDCFGAGQKVAQVTFGGRDWRRAPRTAKQMFEVFAVMRALHELLWYLTEALALPAACGLRDQLSRARAETGRLTHGSPQSLIELDLAAHRQAVNALLLRASELARAAAGQHRTGQTGAAPIGTGPPGPDRSGARLAGARLAGADLTQVSLRGADLTGASLVGARLRGTSLRGALLIGARLDGADLTLADLTGTDLRGADLSDANLAGSIFLTQSQLDSARGDARTGLPPTLSRPPHWA